MSIKSGLGHHDVVLNISGSISQISRTISSITAIVEAPSENLVEHTANAPAMAAPHSTGEPQFYTAAATSVACEEETHTFFAFRHEFAERGTHRISLRFDFSNGEYITTPSAVLIGAGDGLSGDF